MDADISRKIFELAKSQQEELEILEEDEERVDASGGYDPNIIVPLPFAYISFHSPSLLSITRSVPEYDEDEDDYDGVDKEEVEYIDIDDVNPIRLSLFGLSLMTHLLWLLFLLASN